MNDGSLTQDALCIVQSAGQFTLLQACQKILENKYDGGVVREALHYYAKSVLPRVLPLFPALICLSSKAVGANPKNSASIATALLLITASGDIHDDIIDNSTRKFEIKTVVGKYGKNIALLAGDALLIQGTSLLQNECRILSSDQSKKIVDLIVSSMFEIVKAEAIETALWHKENVTPEECFEVIRLKGGVAEVHCRIGAIIGGGDQEAINDLGHYGRVIGVLSTLKEEFVDMISLAELKHRIKHELPPYPMFCAMQNKALKKEIDGHIRKDKLSSEDLRLVSEKVLGSSEVRELTAEFRENGRRELTTNLLLKGNKQASELTVLLKALTDELSVV